MTRAFSRCLLLASLVALPAMAVLAAVYFRPGADLLEQRGYYIGLDFVNYWAGGRLAVAGNVGVLYDIAAYNALLKEWFAPARQFMIFSYPPNVLPLLAPLGALPYFAALPVWLVLGTIAFFAVALGRWPQRQDGVAVLAIALSPVLWVNLNFGQLGLFLALLFVGALRTLPARPLLAGALVGLLSIKPQLGPLLALTLLLTGAWRAIAAAAVTALLLAGLSVALYGLEPWQAWWSETAQAQWLMLAQTRSFFVTQMTTPFSAARALGAALNVALALQGLVALLVLIATWRVLRLPVAWPLKAAIVALGSMLTVPYVLAYDLAIPLAALVWCLQERAVREGPLAFAAVGLMWAVPFALAIVLQAQGLPVAPLAAGLCYVWLLSEAFGWRLSRADAPAPAAIRLRRGMAQG